MDLAQYKSVDYWLGCVQLQTQTHYSRWLKSFCLFMDKNPDQLVELASREPHQVHLQMINFHRKLLDKGYTATSSGGAFKALKSFFSRNDCVFGRTPKHLRITTELVSHRTLRPHEVLAMVVAAPSLRDKAIISFLAQSGQRVGILTAMRYGHVRKQLEQRENPVIVEVTAEVKNWKGVNVNKGRVPYFFALGRECTELLRLMIQWRKRRGEPIDDHSWLFKSNGRGGGSRNGKLYHLGAASSSSPGIHLTPSRVQVIVSRIATNAGIQSSHEFRSPTGELKRFHDIHPHVFRRWWKFRMRMGGVGDVGLLDYMMGHATLSFPYRGAYDHYDSELVRREYTKAEPFLSVTSGLKGDLVDLRQRSQRLVNESEIGPLLEKGWRFVTSLPSGSIIVELPF